MAYEQALHLGESREVTREPHAKGDASARGGNFSHARGHLRVSGVLLDGPRKRETGRSLPFNMPQRF